MKTRIVSAYELLERRLGTAGRLAGSILFLAPRLAWMALILFLVSGKVLVPSLGWPEWSAPVVSISIGMITVLYAMMGGIRAVVLTDVIQAFILFGGALVAIATVTIRMHGFSWLPLHSFPDLGCAAPVQLGSVRSGDNCWHHYFSYQRASAGSGWGPADRAAIPRDTKSAPSPENVLHERRGLPGVGIAFASGGIRPVGLFPSQSDTVGSRLNDRA